MAMEMDGPDQKAVCSTTLYNKVLCGYQGWFNAEDDGLGCGWRHWFHADCFDPSFDLWPDTSEMNADELFPTPFSMADGSTAMLFSSGNFETVDRHFRWMAQYQIHGVFLQRFLCELPFQELRKMRDTVTDHVRRCAEKHGRVFAIMYDITGTDATSLCSAISDDWAELFKRHTNSSAYLHHDGRPVLGIWGLGFDDRPDPGAEAAVSIIHQLRTQLPGAAYVIGGCPTYWRNGTRDSRPDYGDVYKAFDCLLPWTIGRFTDDDGADQYYSDLLSADMSEAAAAGVGLAPVLWPGLSEGNLRRCATGRNSVPRRGGAFLWQQCRGALEQGAPWAFVAMYDEVDEGTAVFKAAPCAAALPRPADALPRPAAGTDEAAADADEAATGADAAAAGARPPRASGGGAEGDWSFIGLDADGLQLPSDYFLRLVGAFTSLMHQRSLSPIVGLLADSAPGAGRPGLAADSECGVVVRLSVPATVPGGPAGRRRSGDSGGWSPPAAAGGKAGRREGLRALPAVRVGNGLPAP